MIETKESYDVQEYSTNISYGLSNSEALARLKKYGKNELKSKKKESIIIKFLKQFNDFMIIILIVASIVSAVISKIEGNGDYIDCRFRCSIL